LRLRLPTPGLVGSPHVHSSCLAPVSSAGMSTYLSACSPPGLSSRFLPTAGLYKRLSQPKQKWTPHGLTAQVLRLFPLLLSPPPRGGGSLALRHLARFRPHQPIVFYRLLLLVSSVCPPASSPPCSLLIASVCPPALSPPSMYAVAAHQLHRASASFISSFLGPFFALRPAPRVQCLQFTAYLLCPLSQARLDGSSLPFLR
jgi:hypothetical protein